MGQEPGLTILAIQQGLPISFRAEPRRNADGCSQETVRQYGLKSYPRVRVTEEQPNPRARVARSAISTALDRLTQHTSCYRRETLKISLDISMSRRLVFLS